MKTNWTTGPWERDSAKDGDSSYQIIHGQLPKGINGDFGYPVADTMNRHHCVSPEEDQANGHLLSAAPELYHAVEALVKAYNQLLPGIGKIACQDYANINDAPIIAERALRKARGGR